MPKRVYIIGGSNGKEICPADAERWGVNATCIGMQVDLSFHLHDLMHVEKYSMTGTRGSKPADFAPFLGYVKFKNHPTYSIKEYEGFPSIMRYPYEEICDYFQTNYFSNSFCYMIAFALWKGYDEIHTYGVNFILADEYADERPGVEFWIAMAHSRGVRLGKEFRMIGEYSRLLRHPRGVNYSFEDKPWYTPEPVPFYRVATWAELHESRAM
jgi:hypothetical protein